MVLHDLRKIPDPDVIRHVNGARGRILEATDKLHQSRLTGPVFPNETDLVIVADVEINAIQQSKSAVSDCQ